MDADDSGHARSDIPADDSWRTRIAVIPDNSRRHTRIKYPRHTRVAIDADDARLPTTIPRNTVFSRLLVAATAGRRW
jgi:hypothetical protein